MVLLWCGYPKCRNTFNPNLKPKQHSILFFNFPFNDPTRCIKWFDNTNNLYLNQWEGYRFGEICKVTICQAHFDPEDLLTIEGMPVKMLKPSAVPMPYLQDTQEVIDIKNPEIGCVEQVVEYKEIRKRVEKREKTEKEPRDVSILLNVTPQTSSMESVHEDESLDAALHVRRSVLTELRDVPNEPATPNKAPSPDEQVIIMRGVRRKPLTWSPYEGNHARLFAPAAEKTPEMPHKPPQKPDINSKLRRRLILSTDETLHIANNSLQIRLRHDRRTRFSL